MQLDRFKKFRGQKGYLDLRLIPIVFTCIPPTTDLFHQSVQLPSIRDSPTSQTTEINGAYNKKD